ncbi:MULTISPECIES: response regulator [Pseudomonas]|jgi:CheY-like chemotaxis protein|uniref:Response regulator n=2 Tax=Pseudomonas TaxID=286 RepID=A0ABS0MTS5_PSELU|nr:MULTISPECIES: response regulator [Pseudomonas]AYN93316.1 response regulator [Pseudomonas sp. LTJR-52]MBA1248728.1 response regulator [Pseudomonas zeshuii]MBH3439865.1 response regulator [Pseudomonas luteola]MBW5412164.1 response regulator [Pseudomonas sp. MAG002Y]MCG7374634.1 response regulator [Pseudomonas luteola]
MTTILVVDDEFLIAEILSFALEDAGFQVKTASNGQKALDALLREQPALVITDFMMPLMNGMELAQAIHDHPDLKAIPIILTTGAQAHIAQQNQHLFNAIFEKPFDVFKVIDTVKALTDTV